uniref:Zinc finger, SWIM-type containing 7 n=1 Tax=Scophthalmus maximus TaxID=52904 RepID=A0A8D3CYS7_SCOMX
CFFYQQSSLRQLYGGADKTYLFKQKHYHSNVLSILKFVFGPCALQALDLVDQRSVTCLSSSSGRKAFQVIGGSGRLYTCFVSCHYCPCPAFAYTVLRRNEGLLCKHILAVYLCQAIGVTQQESVSDQQMSTLLSGTVAP